MIATKYFSILLFMLIAIDSARGLEVFTRNVGTFCLVDSAKPLLVWHRNCRLSERYPREAICRNASLPLPNYMVSTEGFTPIPETADGRCGASGAPLNTPYEDGIGDKPNPKNWPGTDDQEISPLAHSPKRHIRLIRHYD